MKVNIYVETDKMGHKKQERTVMYLLECLIDGVPFTKYGLFMRSGSLNECILEGIIKALERMKKPCHITIFSADSLLLDQIKYHFPGWAVQGFRRKDGKEIKYRDLWMQFHEIVSKHQIETHPGPHEYRNWMIEEIRRKKDEG